MTLSIVVILSCLIYTSAQTIGSVYLNNGEYSFVEGYYEDAVAFGSFNDTLSEIGWGTLKIETNSSYTNSEQMFAAGYLEGYLTSERIEQQYLNVYFFLGFNSSGPSEQLISFLKTQDQWTRSQISSNNNNPYWQTVSLVMDQFDGLISGFTTAAPESNLPMPFAAQMLSAAGDFGDLIPALEVEKRINWKSMNKKEVLKTLGTNGHCSAIVKVPGDLSDLWVGHSTWIFFSAMNRIYKHYNFGISSNSISASKVSFSSYPGTLVSLDDFWMLDSGIVVVETSNSIINQSLYDLVVPETLFDWQRVRVANHMASNGLEWGEIFSQHNSGTYNNQYLVVDYNKFVQGQALQKGLLTVVEQIPGLVIFEDQTKQLERGYWPSYNVPYFKEIYEKSGYPSLVEQVGPSASYQMAPRAEIFRRDQSTVVDLETLQDLMRYNDYKNDPYSGGDPGNAICSRFDLEPTDAMSIGCIDTKVTSYALFMNMTSFALSGPTTSHGLPPFEWSGPFNSSAHFGEPNIYNFSFVEMNPRWED